MIRWGSIENDHVRDDVLHLNDVEPFPKSMEEGFFTHNDVMISLRNTHTVMVFDRVTREIKFVSTGYFIYQHDPDFIDGNRISVYDNNGRALGKYLPLEYDSRIVVVTAPEDTAEVYFTSTEHIPFYSTFMGKHQWLENGNLLITESMKGRAFELTPDKKLVWEYINYVDDDIVGIVQEVQRLPVEFNSIFDAAR